MLGRPKSLEESVELIDQALFEIGALRAAAEYDMDSMGRRRNYLMSYKVMYVSFDHQWPMAVTDLGRIISLFSMLRGVKAKRFCLSQFVIEN